MANLAVLNDILILYHCEETLDFDEVVETVFREGLKTDLKTIGHGQQLDVQPKPDSDIIALLST